MSLCPGEKAQRVHEGRVFGVYFREKVSVKLGFCGAPKRTFVSCVLHTTENREKVRCPECHVSHVSQRRRAVHFERVPFSLIKIIKSKILIHNLLKLKNPS